MGLTGEPENADESRASLADIFTGMMAGRASSPPLPA
jgi:hypothetical protein